MENIKRKEWKSFQIKDLFKTFNGTNGLQVPTGAYISKKLLVDGEIPRITVRNTNNGIDNFSYSKNKNFKTYKNFISVSFLGSVFYHPYEASLDMKVHCLQLKDKELTEGLAQFLIISIKKNIANLCYGNQLSSTDLPNKTILIPVTKNGKPDFNYMENYIKKIQEKKKNEYNKYLEDKLLKLGPKKKIKKLDECDWKLYYLISDQLFYIDEKIRTLKSTSNVLENGEYDVVGATSKNNGNIGFLSKKCKDLVCKGNGICLIKTGEGSVGESVYKLNNFIPSNNVCVIRNNQLSEYVQLFVVNQINLQAHKYNYGYIRNKDRICKEQILLPTKNNKPDYQYMEQFIKNQMIDKLKIYIQFKNDRTIK